MSHTAILTRAEIETMGPPLPDEIADCHPQRRDQVIDGTRRHASDVGLLTTASRAWSMRRAAQNAREERTLRSLGIVCSISPA